MLISCTGLSLVSCKTKTGNDTSGSSSGGEEEGNNVIEFDAEGNPIVTDDDPNNPGNNTNSKTNSGKTASTASGSTTSTPGIIGDITKIKDLKGRHIKIGMSDWYGKKSFDTEMGKYIKKSMDQIAAKYNCTLEIVSIDGKMSLVLGELAYGSSPYDILQGNGPHMISPFIKKGYYLPLDGIGIDFNDAKFDKTVVDALTVRGKHYAVQRSPQGWEKIQTTYMCLYNKRLITDNLYALQDAGNWTWAEMLKIAQRIHNPAGNVWGIADNQCQLYNGLVYSTGGDWISNSNGNFTFTAGSEKAFKALEFYQDLATRYNVLKFTPSADQANFRENKDFREGKVGFIFDYPLRLWNEGYYKGMTDDYGVLYLPKPSASDSYVKPDNYFFYWGIPVGTTKADEVAAVLNEFMNPLIPAKQEKTAFKLQMESISRDQQSFNTLSGLATGTVRGYDAYVGEFLHWGGWFMKLSDVLENKLTIRKAVDENKGPYDLLLKDYFNY